MAGKASDVKGVHAIVVQHVFEEMGLRYDRKSGISHYTGYTGYPEVRASAKFDLSTFLGHKFSGRFVNCSDCASIVATYASMVGARLRYAIIEAPKFSGFPLNPILGIGDKLFRSPFDAGAMWFAYHAVTTGNATTTINDATLALDGDEDPKKAPHKKLLVQNLGGAEYLWRLSPAHASKDGKPEYTYDNQPTEPY